MRKLSLLNQAQPLPVWELGKAVAEGLPALDTLELVSCSGPGLGPALMASGLPRRGANGVAVMWTGRGGGDEGAQDHGKTSLGSSHWRCM